MSLNARHFRIKSFQRLFRFYRQLTGNGTVEFPAFASQFYRSDVHDQVYRCQASNQGGTIISRNVHVRGVVHQFYEVKVEGHEVILNNVAFLKCVVPVHVREHVEITSWYRGEELLTDNGDTSEYKKLKTRDSQDIFLSRLNTSLNKK